MKSFLVLTPFLLYFVLAVLTNREILSLDVTQIQILILPFFLLALSAISLRSKKLPRLLFLLALVPALCSFIMTYPARSQSGFIFSRFKDDKLQTESSKFRERINSYLKKSHQKEISRYHKDFKDYNEVSEFLNHNLNVAGVVWGNKKWLNLSFRDRAPVELRDLGFSFSFHDMDRFKLIDSISNIGMSLEPQAETAAFIAEIIEGIHYREFSLKKSSADNILQFNALRESALANVLRRVSNWTTFAHRSYPFWMLGNKYFSDAVSHGRLEMKKLKCALKSYKTARKFLRRNDNPELMAAIDNNYAVALIVKATFGKNKKLKAKSLKLFDSAMKTQFQKILWGGKNKAIPIVEENIENYLAHNKPKSKRKNKKKNVKR